MSLRKILSDQDLRLLVSGFQNALYVGLLGAGYSRSSTDSGGRELPLGAGLAEELCTKFKLPLNHDLQAVSNVLPESALSEYLVGRFADCTASAGASIIREFPWRQLLTVNIDNVVQDAYRREGALQRLTTLTHKDSYLPARSERDELQIVHLHGFAKRPADGFTFSLRQYANFIRADPTWLAIASDLLMGWPTIVIGASLSEHDIEYALARRTAVSGGQRSAPSLYVSKTIDVFRKERCSRFGLIPVEMESDAFLRELKDICGALHRVSENTIRQQFHGPVPAPAAAAYATFFRQWTLVQPDKLPEESPRPRELLRGVSPHWVHIRENQDVARHASSAAVGRVESMRGSSSGKSAERTVVFSSAAAEGKSTALMRTAHTCALHGMSVYWFLGRERIAAEDAARFLNASSHPAVLVIDDIDRHAFQVNELRELLQSGESTVVLGATRKVMVKQVREQIEGGIIEMAIPELREQEGVELVSKMREAGMLQANSGKSDKELLSRIKRRSFLSAVVELSGAGATFEHIVADEWRGLPADAGRVVTAA